MKKVQELEEGIHKILGESQSCEAEKIKLQDQLDSLTIVAENLASLQQQVRLKDTEIERLNQELETARQEQHQLQLQLDQVKNKLHEKKIILQLLFIFFFREIELILEIKLTTFFRLPKFNKNTDLPLM